VVRGHVDACFAHVKRNGVKGPGFESTVRPKKLVCPTRGYHCACLRRVVVSELAPIHLSNIQVKNDAYHSFHPAA
jgi:hypothetical protein